MKKILLGIIMFYSAGYIGAYAQNPGAHLLATAKLEGRQEVPANTSPAGGIAAVTLNTGRDTLFINASWHSLTGPLTGIHIHDAFKGRVGDVIVDLLPYVKGSRIIGTITGAILTPAFIGKLLKGSLYVNAHTARYPNGEIRGQLYLEKDKSLYSRLTAAQELPPVTDPATGRGLGIVKVSKDSSKVKVVLVVQGLSGPILGAHFHRGPAGVTGPIVKSLVPLISGGNSVIGEVDSSGGYVKDLLAGKLYFNVHTSKYPGGEARGQVFLDSTNLVFDASATAAQAVEPVSTYPRAKAAVLAKLSPTLDSLYIEAVFAGLSGRATGAHLHEEAVGRVGNTVVELYPQLRDSLIVLDTITDFQVNKDLINNLLAGRIYFDAETELNPSGELRGQMNRVARIGFTGALTGTQERPTPNTSAATGTAYASFDRDWTELHWASVATGLADPLTGAHFHTGKINEAGPIIYDLTPKFMKMDTVDQAHGFIRDAVTPAPTVPLATNAVNFLRDSVYINLHNPTYPGGEIRGQMLKGGRAETVTATAANSTAIEDIQLSPNPTSGISQLIVNSSENGNGQITITDLAGVALLTQNVSMTSGNNNYAINLESLNNGTYIVLIQNGNNRKAKKVVKY